jgi:hypothetical protein
VSAEVSIEKLQRAVEEMHGCSATWLESASVPEAFQGRPAWNSVVQIFAITGNLRASKCYAWSSPMEDNQGRQFFAVLEIAPIRSAADAVRAAIAQMQRFGNRRFTNRPSN